MKPLDEAARAAIIELSRRRLAAEAESPAASVPVVLDLPEMPPDLRRLVDLVAGRNPFYASAEPEHHPEAALFAAGLRPRLQPTAPEAIAIWIAKLAAGKGNAPTGAAMEDRIRLTVLACRKLPIVCWTDETLGDALGEFTFWPEIAELKDFLARYAEDLNLDIGALDRIAKTPPGRRGPARESPVAYDPGGAPAWCFKRELRPASGPIDRERDLVVISATSVAAQLAAFDLGDVDLLAKRRAQFPQQGPKPEGGRDA